MYRRDRALEFAVFARDPSGSSHDAHGSSHRLTELVTPHHWGLVWIPHQN